MPPAIIILSMALITPARIAIMIWGKYLLKININQCFFLTENSQGLGERE